MDEREDLTSKFVGVRDIWQVRIVFFKNYFLKLNLKKSRLCGTFNFGLIIFTHEMRENENKNYHNDIGTSDSGISEDLLQGFKAYNECNGNSNHYQINFIIRFF
ncbi:MAG: hypothetical protein COU29_01965 [Candidatus Magasanikbacteria bacterium CG10_big_fil_rev_8_21_14_0_10_36_32]|uniref:Uncharacterized protein n=1 Tax=Candidatus Magasanikbacteria bacterium CG10_big_fil_rev_8_21_14_0_10_36_32 TaxID=1974646 RepID=A0A2M6W6V3_9BACT|nr:MAG: hypothetical protein COU29_01965 [Candidatus Magasanikbacteria bacterium CG10_big_fil_rev_8_21_14_0_10_36_32]